MLSNYLSPSSVGAVLCLSSQRAVCQLRGEGEGVCGEGGWVVVVAGGGREGGDSRRVEGGGSDKGERGMSDEGERGEAAATS